MCSKKITHRIDPRDVEFINGLKVADETISQRFFYDEIGFLLARIRSEVFQQRVRYEEMVSELYLFLCRDNWAKLNGFEAINGCRLRTWMIPLAWRYFVGIRNRLLVGRKEILVEEQTELCNQTETPTIDIDLRIQIAIDVKAVIDRMPNERYSELLRLLFIEGFDHSEVAEMLGIKIENLYNLKRRAIAQFIEIYGRR